MKKNFTQLIIIMLLYTSPIWSQQQYNNLIVNSQDGSQVPYLVGNSEFGLTYGDPKTGIIVLANDGEGDLTDGCTPITNDVTEAIVLIDRGACSFVDKAQHAKEAGALAAIICIDEGQDVFTLGGTSADMWIPVLSMSYNDCQILKLSLSDSLSGTIIYGNVQLDRYWYSGAANLKTPVSQVDDVVFMTDVINRSDIEISDAYVSVEVRKGPETIYLYESDNLGPIASDDTLKNQIIGPPWEMLAEVGNYEVAYHVTTNAIADPPSVTDQVTRNFIVSESTFSKVRSEEEVGAEYLTYEQWYTPDLSSANGYYVTNGDGLRPSQLTTGFGQYLYSILGDFYIRAEVIEWQADTNEDQDVDMLSEIKTIAEGVLFFDTNDQVNLRKIDIPLKPVVEGEGFASSGQYFAVIHVEPVVPITQNVAVFPLTADFWVSDDYVFFPTHLAHQFYGLSSLGRPASYELWDYSSSSELRPLTAGSHSLYITMEISDQFVSSSKDFDKDISMSIHPNPASDLLKVTLDLAETDGLVTIELLNFAGEIVTVQEATISTKDDIVIELDQIPSGVYLVNIHSGNDVISEKVIIQH